MLKRMTFLSVFCTVFFIAACTQNNSILSEHVLSNNLRVIVDQSQADQVEVRLLIKTGSLQEHDNQQGFAHFVEHLAFNHTEKFPKETLFRQLESLGISPGIHSNAFTNFNSTLYNISLKAPTDEKLATALEILAQWAMHIQFDQKIIDAEKPIVKEEWRLRHPQEQGWQAQYLKAIHKDSRYANRLPIGDMSIIEQATATDLEAFYKKWYQPHNAALIITGAVNTDKVKKRIEQYFGDWKSTHAITPKVYNLSIDSIPEKLILADAKVDQNIVQLDYYLPYSRPRSTEALLERQIWGSGLDILRQRLKNRLQETKGKVSDVGVFWEYPSPDILHVGVFSTVSGEDLETATRLINEETQKLIQHGVTETELKTWTESKLAKSRTMKDTPEGAANLAVRHFLYDNPLSTWDEWLEQLEGFLPTLTAAQLNKLMGDLLSVKPNMLLVHNPDIQPPSQAQISIWLASSAKTALASVQQPTPENKERGLWQIAPETTGEIVASRVINADLKEWTLSNGIKVYYRYSKEQPGKVWYHLSGIGGTDQLTQEQTVHARLALETIGSSGLREMNGPQLAQWISDNNLSLRPFYNFWERGAYGSSLKQDFAIALRLLHVSLTEGRVSPQAWEHNLGNNRQQLIQLSKSRIKPWREAIDTTLFQNDSAFRSVTLAELSAVTPDHLSAIYKDYYSGAQNYRLAIVGDIDEASARQAVLESMATLPAVQSTATLTARPFPRITKPSDLTISASGERAASLMYKLTLDKTKLPSLTFSELSYLQPWLRSTFMRELREKDGLVYSVNVAVEGGVKALKDFTLTIELACDPDKVAVVRERIAQILTNAAQNSEVTEERLAAWQAEKQAELQDVLNKPAELSVALLFASLLGIPLEKAEDIDYRTQRPMPESLQAALKMLIGPEAIPVWMVWMP